MFIFVELTLTNQQNPPTNQQAENPTAQKKPCPLSELSSSLPPPKDPAPKQWIAGTKAPFYRHQSSLETPSLLPLPTTPHSYQGQCPTMLPHNTPLNDPHQAYCCFQKHCPDSGHCLAGQLGQRTPHLLYAHSLWSTIFTQAVIAWSK